uniref:Chromosome (Plasmid) partitioning protein ParB n=1 Tax=Streptococcus suis TaxID=1307 RepID=A0A6G6AU60_STRSU|nr:Chromosome (plasmid) partitioning protein ParB [Streptococcus suis]
MKKQDFKVLKTKDLYPFPDNPFHVAEDETLSELAESIKGIVNNHTPERGRDRL